jgi:anti-anti-sigma factor
VQLELLNFPVGYFERALEHAAGVQRELDVLRVDEARADRVPRRMDEIVADLDTRFSGYRATMDILASLVQQRADHADVSIPVLGEPEERAVAIVALRDLLDEVDRYCEAGDLLTVVTPPDLREFRDWLFEEVIGQLRGASPRPWSGSSATTVAPMVEPVGLINDGPAVVVRESGSLDLGDAARLRDAIQSAFTTTDADVDVDLTAVDFVDSVVLSVFVTAHKRFSAVHRNIAFLVPPHLLRVFELTGLVGVLDVRTAGV